MMLGIPNLTEEMVKQAYFCLPHRIAEELKAAEGNYDEWLSVARRYRPEILKALGIEDPYSKFHFTDEFAGHIRAYAASGQSDFFSSSFEQLKEEDIFSVVAWAGADFWRFVGERVGASDTLEYLNGFLGSCTPKLVQLLMYAPKDIPLTILLAHAKDIPVDECPDVPLDFIDNFPELHESMDYQEAFMKAYITSCLKLFFNADKVDKHLSRYTPETMRQFFPRIAWELSGHSFYDGEEVLFDAVKNW